MPTACTRSTRSVATRLAMVRALRDTLSGLARVGDEPHPLAAEALQFAVERAVLGGDDDARAGAQQRDRDDRPPRARPASRSSAGRICSTVAPGRPRIVFGATASVTAMTHAPIEPVAEPLRFAARCGETRSGARRRSTRAKRHGHPPSPRRTLRRNAWRLAAAGPVHDAFLPEFLKIRNAFRRTGHRGAVATRGPVPACSGSAASNPT